MGQGGGGGGLKKNPFNGEVWIFSRITRFEAGNERGFKNNAKSTFLFANHWQSKLVNTPEVKNCQIK